MWRLESNLILTILTIYIEFIAIVVILDFEITILYTQLPKLHEKEYYYEKKNRTHNIIMDCHTSIIFPQKNCNQITFPNFITSFPSMRKIIMKCDSRNNAIMGIKKSNVGY